MDAYTGEIRAFGFDFAPQDWAFCNGQSMNVAQYQALYSVIGLTYGGTPGVSFNLPDLRGRAAMAAGTGTGLTPRALNAATGTRGVALTVAQMPMHNHSLKANNTPNATLMAATPGPTTALSRVVIAGSSPLSIAENFSNVSAPNTTLAQQAIGSAGGNSAHDNVQPLLVMNFCICLNGYYPVHD